MRLVIVLRIADYPLAMVVGDGAAKGRHAD